MTGALSIYGAIAGVLAEAGIAWWLILLILLGVFVGIGVVWWLVIFLNQYISDTVDSLLRSSSNGLRTWVKVGVWVALYFLLPLIPIVLVLSIVHAIRHPERIKGPETTDTDDRLDNHTREEEADILSALKALKEQTEQAGDAMGTKEAQELRVWLNDRGISDREITEYDMNDLLEETLSREGGEPR